jgi:Holliday junction DNA helicase RuvA
MIGRLHGELADKQAPYLLLDVNGVGYELEVPMSTFFDLPDTGAQVTLRPCPPSSTCPTRVLR